MKNNSSGESEEDDKMQNSASQFVRYSHPKKPHTNPLVHNKGSAHFSKEVGPKEQNQPTLEEFKPKIESQLKVPSQDEAIVKKSSIASVCSNISEFDVIEKLQKAENPFFLPLFEIHGTLQLLIQGSKGRYLSSVNLPDSSYANGMPLRSHSIRTEEKENIQISPGSLSEKQVNFIKMVNSISTNYISHVLNNRDLYFQYVAISKSPLDFMNSEFFISRMDNLMKQKRNYERDIKLYQSNIFYTCEIIFTR